MTRFRCKTYLVRNITECSLLWWIWSDTPADAVMMSLINYHSDYTSRGRWPGLYGRCTWSDATPVDVAHGKADHVQHGGVEGQSSHVQQWLYSRLPYNPYPSHQEIDENLRWLYITLPFIVTSLMEIMFIIMICPLINVYIHCYGWSRRWGIT